MEEALSRTSESREKLSDESPHQTCADLSVPTSNIRLNLLLKMRYTLAERVELGFAEEAR